MSLPVLRVGDTDVGSSANEEGASAKPSIALAPPFTGSTQALTTVTSAVRQRPSVVFVEGAAGMGKSTLVRASIEAAGCPATWFACRPAGPPLQLPRSQPTVLVLEDIQWLDDTGRALVRTYLADLTETTSVVLTYRADELDVPGVPLGDECRVPPATKVVGVALRPLERDEIRAVLAARALAVDDASVDRACRRSGGIPALLAALVDARGGPAATVDVPPVAAQWLARRRVDMSAPAQQLLCAAAVLDRAATEAQLATVAGIPAAEVMAPLCELLSSGLIRETDAGRYVVTAGLLQHWVYVRIPGPQRQRVHARAVVALNADEPVDLLALVKHCRAAGDVAESVRHAEAAAEAALAVGSTEEAIELLQATLAEPSIAPAARARLAVRLARFAAVGLRREDTVGVLHQLVRDSRVPAGVRGEIRLGLGLLLMNQAGQGDAGRGEIARAASELRRRPALAARAMSALAMPQWGSCHADEHLWWLARAEQAAANGRDAALSTAVLANRVSLLLNLGDPAVWREIDRLPAHEGTIAQQQQVGRAYANLTDAAVWLGHYGAAARFSGEARRLAAQTGAEYVVALARSAELRMDWAVGRWSALDHRAERLLADFDNLPLLVADARLTLAQLALARGEWTEAIALLDVTQLLETGAGCGPELSAASAVRVWAWCGSGDVRGAVEEGRRALDRERVKGVWGWSGELVSATVDALLRAGLLDEARVAVDDLAAGIADRDAPLADATVLSCRAALAEAAGETARAVAGYDRARDAYERLPRPYDAARALEGLARCRSAEGSEADHLLALATDEYATLGAAYDAGRCGHLLRARGSAAPSRRGRRSYGRELSPRESDVARLMGLGRTNREIAEVLFISVRTVELHAARVLRKLRVTDRAHVADRLR